MSLLRDIAKVYGEPGDDEERKALAAILTGHARHFLQGGGVVSMGDWLSLDTDERAALSAAGLSLAVEQAVRSGQAASGELGALKAHAQLDGGRAHDEALLRQSVNSIARALNGGGNGRA